MQIIKHFVTDVSNSNTVGNVASLESLNLSGLSWSLRLKSTGSLIEPFPSEVVGKSDLLVWEDPYLYSRFV